MTFERHMSAICAGRLHTPKTPEFFVHTKSCTPATSGISSKDLRFQAAAWIHPFLASPLLEPFAFPLNGLIMHVDPFKHTCNCHAGLAERNFYQATLPGGCLAWPGLLGDPLSKSAAIWYLTVQLLVVPDGLCCAEKPFSEFRQGM